MSRVIADGLSQKATATTQEAEDAVAGKYPDAAGVHAAFNQYGLGTTSPPLISDMDDQTLPAGLYAYDPSTSGTLPPLSTPVGSLLVTHRGARTIQTSFHESKTNPVMHIRVYNSGWGDWSSYYHSANILGTVSQSGGVPTGAIIERGSNANGEYVKFADGTLICYYESTSPKTTSTPSGSLYLIDASAYAFPVNFVARPKVSRYAHRNGISGNGPSWTSSAADSDVTNTQVRIVLISSINTAVAAVGYIAIGRWF